MRLVVALLLALALAACGGGVEEPDPATAGTEDPQPARPLPLSVADGASVRYSHSLLLSKDGKREFEIVRDVRLAREPAASGAILSFVCERLRVRMGDSQGLWDFDSDDSTVEDVMSVENPPDIVRAARLADTALGDYSAQFDAAGVLRNLEAIKGELATGDGEDDPVRSLLAELSHRPEMFLLTELDNGWWKHDELHMTLLGPRVRGTLELWKSARPRPHDEAWLWDGEAVLRGLDGTDHPAEVVMSYRGDGPGPRHTASVKLVTKDGEAGLGLYVSVMRLE